ncbi:MAG: MFS transporter [Candidatus Aenigmarchaeota archaeon]|nr:MFS transporter [Candidatus Aenigmarchaeota archaeon]
MKLSYKSNIWKYYIFYFLCNFSFIGGILIPFFTEWGGLNFTQIMFLQSWFMLWSFILEVPTGAVADYVGRKHSLILAAFLNGLGFLVYVSSSNFYIFLLGEFILAMALALSSGAGEAFVYDSLKKIGKEGTSKKVFTRMQTFKLIGIMLGAPLGSTIAGVFGVRTPVILMSIPLTLATIISLTFKEPETHKKSESTRYIKILKKGLKYYKDNHVLKILTFDVISIAVVGYLMIWLYQPLLEQANVPVEYFGFVHSFMVVAQITIINSYSKLEGLLKSKKRMLFLSSSITGLMFILGGLTNFVPLVLISIIVGGGFGLTRRPLFGSYINKHVPSSERATILSTMTMLRRFAMTLINPIVGMLADWSLNYTFILIGTVALICTLLSKVEEEYLID